MNFLTDPNLQPWLIPVGPLLAFLIITLATNKAKLTPSGDMVYGGFRPPYGNMPIPVATPWSRILSITVGMGGIIMSLLVSWSVVFNALGMGHSFGEKVFGNNIEWLATGTTALKVGVLVDPLNATLLFMVPLAVLCIFIYSIGYMANDPRQSRFFALISLFAGAMLTLTVSDNLLFLFVGWEVMGLCSFMLIGFWFEKESAYKAAIKAFTTTRVADVIMLLGIVYLYQVTGTLNYREIMFDPAMLEKLASTPAILLGSFGFSASSLIGVFLIVGTIGKSAQFPLHVWLPDAMQGPTPVSAMIHAAAMVSAGIYAIIRMYPVFVGTGALAAFPHEGIFTPPLLLMGLVGAFTALFAATMAVAQNDVKAVLAYSTISQLGFMMAALGMGAYVAATFHLITHAFFKALLFMSSGSVIHAMEHGEHHVHEHAHGHGHGDDHGHAPAAIEANAHEHGAHDHSEVVDAHDDHGHGHAGHDEHGHGEEHAAHDEHTFDPQDMMNMGGLRNKIPVTFYAFMIGGFSLAGFPLVTAGFWSKDEILADAWLGAREGFGLHAFIFVLLAVAAFLTAFYTMRQLALTFFGEARTEEAKHAGLGGPNNIISQTMQLPLIILSFFAIFAGFVGVPGDFPILGSIFSGGGESFFGELVSKSLIHSPQAENLAAHAPAFNAFPVLVSFIVALGGLYLGWVMYGRKPLKAGERDPLIDILGEGLHTTLRNRYYMDDLYTMLFVKPSQAVSGAVGTFIDKGLIDTTLHAIAKFFTVLGDFIKVMNLWLIDGVSDGIPNGIYKAGGWLRRTQSGRVQQYLLAVLIVAVLIGVILAVTSGALAAPR